MAAASLAHLQHRGKRNRTPPVCGTRQMISGSSTVEPPAPNPIAVTPSSTRTELCQKMWVAGNSPSATKFPLKLRDKRRQLAETNIFNKKVSAPSQNVMSVPGTGGLNERTDL